MEPSTFNMTHKSIGNYVNHKHKEFAKSGSNRKQALNIKVQIFGAYQNFSTSKITKLDLVSKRINLQNAQWQSQPIPTMQTAPISRSLWDKKHTRRFCGFTSLWQTPGTVWMYANPLNICTKKLTKLAHYPCSRPNNSRKTPRQIYKENRTDLIHIKLHKDKRHPLIGIAVMLQHTVKGFRHILHDQVEEKLISAGGREEAMLQRDDVRMIHGAHQLQLTVFISPILQHLLYCHGFSRFQTFRL